MKPYWLRLFPEQPFSLDDETTIPAGALRGAIAAVLLSTCIPGHEHDTGPCSAGCRYWSLFGEGAGIRIGPAYAGSRDETQPFLATARTCSAAPGFKTVGGHGVCDIAIRQWVFERAAVEPQRLLIPFGLRCPVCDALLIPCAGTVTQQGERDYEQARDIASPIKTRHASLGRTRKQVVDTHDAAGRVMSTGVYFVARLDVPDRLDGLLRETLAEGLRIGKRRSRGMGAMRAELAPRPSDSRQSLDDRIAHFNQAVRAEQRFYAAMDVDHPADDTGDWYFTLDLPGAVPTVYEAVPSAAPIPAALLPVPAVPSLAPVRQWLSPQVMGGWHAAAGLPRRTQIGAAGVILYRVPAESNRRAVEEVLAYVETEGIGTPGRSFGVTICDPFHLMVDMA